MINTVRKYLFLLLAVLLCAAACGEGASEENIRKTEFEKMNIPLDQETSGIFAVTEEGELFSVRMDGSLVQLGTDGTLKNTYDGFAEASALCCIGRKLYACVGMQNKLVCLDMDTGKTETMITETVENSEVTNLVTAGGKLYAHAKVANTSMFKRSVYEIDPKKKSVNELPLSDVEAIYGASDGKLYYCTQTAHQYQLYVYDADKQEGVLIYDLDDICEIRQITVFAYEKDYFVYNRLDEKPCVAVVSVKEGNVAECGENVILMHGKYFQCVAGNLVYYVNSAETDQMHLYYLPEQNFQNQNVSDDGQSGAVETVDDPAPTQAAQKAVTISTSSPTNIDVDAIKKEGGPRVRVVKHNAYSDEFIAELMSGNSDVDIYVFNMTAKEAQTMKDNGMYVPLNSSEIICEYRDKCFDYIAEEMITESGDIWALPYSTSFDGSWYVPENLEKCSVRLSDLSDWKSFFDICETFGKNAEYHACVPYSTSLGDELWTQYDRTFCDFSNGIVDYRSKLFRDYFDRMWSGWIAYSDNPSNPSLYKPVNSGDMGWESEEYQKEKTLLSYEYINKSNIQWRKELDGWRVFPAPRLDESVDKNSVNLNCVIINPYSENKELAMQYLECIAQNPGVFSPIQVAFLFKDMSMYEGLYDLSVPAIQDIYNIAQEGALRKMIYPYTSMLVNDYQQGRYTLDEAIEKIQRDTEMWLNE